MNLLFISLFLLGAVNCQKVVVPFVKVYRNESSGNHLIILEQPASNSSVKILAYGSHIISWKQNGVEKLFCSSLSPLDGSRPIRGGIPIVFPQFAGLAPATVLAGNSLNRSQILPLHGFARNSIWRYRGHNIKRLDKSIMVTMSLDHTRIPINASRIWPFAFQSKLRVKLDFDGRLSMNLTVVNKDTSPFTFDVLFHNYFAVSQIRNVVVGGLANTTFIDKTRNFTLAMEPNAGYRSYSSFTDNVYHAFKLDKLTLFDLPKAPSTKLIRALSLEKFNLKSIVTWNPFERRTDDLAPGDSERFLAIEFGTVGKLVESYGNPVSLDPGQEWVGGQTFSSNSG